MFAIMKKRTPAELADVFVAPGRKYGQVAGSHIDNFVMTQRAIWLCGDCLPKFNPLKYGYVPKLHGKNRLPFVRGNCDGCKQHDDQMRMLVHHTQAME
jgi:hypothetical protein|tara:strand:+ start:4159 stop:4452 length:294 start_codon:yes stop_codon:yes gene_type:complete